jgi:hypothetical protein
MFTKKKEGIIAYSDILLNMLKGVISPQNLWTKWSTKCHFNLIGQIIFIKEKPTPTKLKKKKGLSNRLKKIIVNYLQCYFPFIYGSLTIYNF